MKIKIAVITVLSFLAHGHFPSAFAQTTILDTDFSTGIPAGWSTFDADGLTPAEPVAEFTDAWIAYLNAEDTAAASTSYYATDEAGTAEDYLITPRISLGNFSRLIWTARSVDASYPDGYQILISTTDSLPESFTDTLFSTFAETPYYSTRSIHLDEEGYANQDIFIAIRNTTTDGYVLLLDELKVLGAETAQISNADDEILLTLYPNPVHDQFMIQTDELIEQVQIYNLAGKLLIQQSATATVDVGELPKGVYQVVIQTSAGIARKKIIKA